MATTHCTANTYQEHQTFQIQANSTREAPRAESPPAYHFWQIFTWWIHNKRMELLKIQTLSSKTWIKALNHSPRKKERKRRGSLRSMTISPARNSSTFPCPMPHRRDLSMHRIEMLLDLGPDRALRGAARVCPNREASRQCRRRIGVSSRAFVLDFIGLCPSCRPPRPPAVPVTSPLHWVSPG